MRIIYYIMILSLGISGQEYSNPPPKCYVVNNIQVGSTIEHVEAAYNTKLKRNKTKENELFVINDNLVYVYKRIIWRIQYKDTKLPCKYKDNVYIDGDIKVFFDGKHTFVTDLQIWKRILTNN